LFRRASRRCRRACPRTSLPRRAATRLDRLRPGDCRRGVALLAVLLRARPGGTSPPAAQSLGVSAARLGGLAPRLAPRLLGRAVGRLGTALLRLRLSGVLHPRPARAEPPGRGRRRLPPRALRRRAKE